LPHLAGKPRCAASPIGTICARGLTVRGDADDEESLTGQVPCVSCCLGSHTGRPEGDDSGREMSCSPSAAEGAAPQGHIPTPDPRVRPRRAGRGHRRLATCWPPCLTPHIANTSVSAILLDRRC